MMSLSRWRKDKDGGRRELILKTFGSTSSLCPTTGQPLVMEGFLLSIPERLWDLETRPGTEACNI